VHPGVGRHLAPPAASEDLTAREIDVVRQLALGRSNRDIAAALNIGEETVKSHVGHVLGKLRAENRAQAVVQAIRRGLVRLEELE
jgi:DNA-binding CsgD family transcriptional regulator